MKRVETLFICIALVAAACGSGIAGPVDPGEATTTTQASPSTTTTTTPTTTAPPDSTSTTEPVDEPSPSTISVAPWFYIDEAGHPQRTGPFLFPIHREVAHTTAIARASLEQLFAGPTAEEGSGVPGISTTIPAGVEILGLTIGEGIALVDLSGEFEGDDDSPVVAQRMAQVVFTLTSIPNVTEVLFRQDGTPLPAQTSQGELVTRPVMKADYLDFAAALTVESPVYDGSGDSPLHVTGFGAAFEATFNYSLTDDDGLIIAEGIAMTTNGTGWGGFDFTIDYDVDEGQTGALIVWVYSAEDGSQIDVREYPVTLTP